MSYFIRTKIVCFLFGVLFVLRAFFVDLVKHKRIAELYVECEYIKHILYIDIELTTNTYMIDERQIYEKGPCTRTKSSCNERIDIELLTSKSRELSARNFFTTISPYRYCEDQPN